MTGTSEGRRRWRNKRREEATMTEVTVYQLPDFQGSSRSFGVGDYRFFTEADMNDTISSIRVPDGLVAMVFEHADSGGGFGRSADLLED